MKPTYFSDILLCVRSVSLTRSPAATGDAAIVERAVNLSPEERDPAVFPRARSTDNGGGGRVEVIALSSCLPTPSQDKHVLFLPCLSFHAL